MPEVAPQPSEWNTRDEQMADGPRSFEEFFDAERARLFRALVVITGSGVEAEDIAQDAFLRVWERWDRVGGLEDPAGYLHRTAMNVFRDRYRRAVLSMKRAVRAAPQPDAYDAVEAHAVVSEVLGHLAPRQRAAIVLTEAFGYSAEEAGRLLGIKGSTVRALNFQARSVLKGHLEQIDG